MRAIVVTLTLFAVLVAAAPATAASPRTCRQAGSDTIDKNGYARVYEIPGGTELQEADLYGCLWSQNRPTKLAESFDDDYVLGYGYFDVRLARRFVAWAHYFYDISCKADCPPGYDSTDDGLVVYSLSRRKVYRATEGVVIRGSLRLTRSGAVAWAERTDDGETAVRALDADGRRTLDSGDIAPGSLSLKGLVLRWTKAGERRSATLR